MILALMCLRRADIRKSGSILVYGALADVIEASRHVETEQKTGNVVLTVG